jgi:hypothetical protein
MVRMAIFALLPAVLALAAWSQAPQPAEKPREYFFAGYITVLSEDQVTVRRTVLGDRSSTRTFAITPETRIEGEPRVKARVTVQYVPEEEGDRAVQIIVRAAQKKP